MNNFKTDLKKGVACEERVLKILKNEYPDIVRVEGHNPDYDLVSAFYSAEVKFDEMSFKTDNIGLEIRCNNQPSGLSVTQADEWIHIFFYKDWGYSRISVDMLKSFVKANINFFKIVKGGDDNLSEMVLIPKYIVIKNFGFDLI